MPVELPNLDDRRFTDLVEEAMAILPRHAPEWTNHNPSDPGITLVELLAYFTEMLLFRTNQVSRECRLRFLQLIRGQERVIAEGLLNAPGAEIDAALREAVKELRKTEVAVTVADYDHLARRATRDNPVGRRVARAHCVPAHDLARDDPARERPGHVSVVLIPERDQTPQDLDAMIDQVSRELEPRRLLTTRLHVVGPSFIWIAPEIELGLIGGADADAVKAAAIEALERFFSPVAGGGPNAEGWPFGRPVYLSEVYALLEDQVEGVDYVARVQIADVGFEARPAGDVANVLGVQIGTHSRVAEDTRLGMPSLASDRWIRDAAGRLAALALAPWEVVRLAREATRIHLIARGAGRPG